MSKLRFKKIEEGGSVVAARGFYYHPSDPTEDSLASSKDFDFDYIGTYPANYECYVWDEGIFTCILYAASSSDGLSSIVVIGGVRTTTEHIRSPKDLVGNLNWAVVSSTHPESIRDANKEVRYTASNIKISGGLFKSGILNDWKLDISSEILSTRTIKNGLLGI